MSLQLSPSEQRQGWGLLEAGSGWQECCIAEVLEEPEMGDLKEHSEKQSKQWWEWGLRR
jgi:hypothetical protein